MLFFRPSSVYRACGLERIFICLVTPAGFSTFVIFVSLSLSPLPFLLPFPPQHPPPLPPPPPSTSPGPSPLPAPPLFPLAPPPFLPGPPDKSSAFKPFGKPLISLFGSLLISPSV